MTNYRGGAHRRLDASGLKKLESNGPIVVLEKILGSPLAHKKGMTYGGKTHLRDYQLRCVEQWLVIGGSGGELEKEKRYTFYGNFEGVHCEFFKWSLNNKSKLSWMDSEAGMGAFTFYDRDADGQYERLECHVHHGEQLVEVFDISDPWNIKFSSDEELLERNLQLQKEERAVEKLRKKFQAYKYRGEEKE